MRLKPKETKTKIDWAQKRLSPKETLKKETIRDYLRAMMILDKAGISKLIRE